MSDDLGQSVSREEVERVVSGIFDDYSDVRCEDGVVYGRQRV